MWVETLEADFERLLGKPLEGRLRHPQRLRVALRRLDRYADFGQGRQGAGVEVAQQLIEGYAAELTEQWDEYGEALRRREEESRGWAAPSKDAPPKRPIMPRHLGFFIPDLLQIGRRWRRMHRRAFQERRRAERALRAIRTIDSARPRGHRA